MNNLIGQSLGRYHIIEQLGEGGMAIVYKAYDTHLEAEVAVKVIRTERLSQEILQKALKRFEREAKALAQLTHPNLVKVLDYGKNESVPYLIMPYLPGGTLKQKLNGQAMAWQEAGKLLIPIARALEYAHKRGLIHRDVKPSNILITESGEPMLTDFGIAKMIDEEVTMDLTGTSAAIGTPEYMAPEQVTSKTVDHRADIYALGIVFYEMVTGRRPYQADTPMAVLFKHASEPLPRPTQFVSGLPSAVEKILWKSLAKKPEDRYEDMGAFASALENLVQGMRLTKDERTRKHTEKEFKSESTASVVQPKSWSWLNLVVAGVLAIILLGGGIWIGSSLLKTSTSIPTATEASVLTLSSTEAPPATSEAVVPSEPVKIRWFVGLGSGDDPAQVAMEEEVVSDFNASHSDIELVLEVVPRENTRDVLAERIASGDAPDIVGPVGWGASAPFVGEWLNLESLIESSGYDLSQFEPFLVDVYQSEEDGQVGLPFALFPAATWFVPELFEEAGLNYPPKAYGEKYVMPDGTEVVWNWDTFVTVARRLTLDINGNNATSARFNRNQVVQYGYGIQWQTSVPYQGSYLAGAADIVSGSSPGNYESAIPSSWKDVHEWIYNGVWGEQPFIATAAFMADPALGNGNPFNSGKVAMTILPSWYFCCVRDLSQAGYEFQLAALPLGNDGKVHGRMDADTFRIWKGTKYPDQAFEVYTYLIGTGSQKLLLSAYCDLGCIPARASEADEYFARVKETYPFLSRQSWNILIAGLAYADTPNAEQYQPNWSESWARQQDFFNLLLDTSQLNLDEEWQKLINDLNVIYNK